MMPFITVKTHDGEVLGMMREEPQTTTHPPPWLATRPDEHESMPCATMWDAVRYLQGREGWMPSLHRPIQHPPVPTSLMVSSRHHHVLKLGEGW